MITETFDSFCKRMAEVELTKSFVVGRMSSGDTRDVFKFEGQSCWLESFGYRPTSLSSPAKALYAVLGPSPSDRWVCPRLIYGPGYSGKKHERIKRIAKYYRARYEEDPYPWEEDVWFYLYFTGDDNWEKLMKLVWDVHTGKFIELWGEEAKVYKSCIGCDLEQTPEELVKTLD